MGVLEQVVQMKGEGKSDEEIKFNLQQQGVSPKEINDTLIQAQIKNAVFGEEGAEEPSEYQASQPYYPQAMPEEDVYTPQPERGQANQEYYYQPQENYPSDNYDYQAVAPGSNVDTIIEVSEQVFSEKIKNIQKKIDDLTEFKTLSQTKLENISERFKRIEKIIDQLQVSILEKVGSYGGNLENIKKEMSMMQDSFGKVVNQAVKGNQDSSSSHIKTLKKISNKK